MCAMIKYLKENFLKFNLHILYANSSLLSNDGLVELYKPITNTNILQFNKHLFLIILTSKISS